MPDHQPYIAIIPARGGSKRLPGKNLLPLAGKPLIAWTIEAAIGSGVFERVVVSTDDPGIAAVAAQYGAEVPFLRPAGLATDTTPTIDVLMHAIRELSGDGPIPWTHLACLQPTSPLRTAENIREAARLLEAKNADAVISVCQTEHSPLWANTIPKNLSLAGFIPEQVQKTPSQQLPVYYRLNGAIYFCRIERILIEQTLFLPDSAYAFVMGREDSIDVDDQVDFELAAIYSGKRK
ncbi:MAG: acylneuraminate cytidylyltransferase family protein [Bacteroidales bacterium]